MAARRRTSPPQLAAWGRAPFLNRIALDRASVPSFDAYPFSLAAVRNLDELEVRSPVTVFVGENGMGKSTLLEAIAVSLGFNPEGGSKSLRFETRGSHSELHRYLRLSRSSRPRDGWFLRAESFYNAASAIDGTDEDPDNRSTNSGPPIVGAYGGISLHEQSHGESFFALAFHRFGRNGLYLLDEPESALSPQRQLALLARMHDLVAKGSQFLFATHAPILMAWPGADVWSFTDDGIRRTKADETDHWRVLRRFLAHPDSVLADLLTDERSPPDPPV